MIRSSRMMVVALLLAFSAIAAARFEGTQNRDLVRRAVLDYVEGFYEGDTLKLVRSLRPDLAKYGFSRSRTSTTYVGSAMSYREALDYAARVKARNQPAPPTAPKEIVLLDVQDQTAAAKLTAWWGTDYLLVGKYDGKWMISHVVWQSPPAKVNSQP